MRTELLHSFSSNSLANLSRGPSSTNVKGVKEGQINPAFISEDYGFSSRYSENSNNSGASDGGGEKVSTYQMANALCRNIFRKKLLYKKFPVLKWSQEYNTSKLFADIIAGLTIGFTILPQGLAYSKIAGLPSQYGLYSGFCGCFLYILLGGCKPLTIGPTAIMSIITLNYTQGKGPEFAVILCFFSGLVTFLMGIFQLGFIVNFISTPVISAFTSSAALTICSTQIKPLFGLSFKANTFRDVILGTFEHLDEIKYRDAILSLVCIVVLLSMQNLQAIFKSCTKNYPKLDRVLWFIATSRSVIVIVLCTAIFSYIDPELFPVDVVGSIEPGLPPIQLPPFTISQNISGVIVETSSLQLLNEDLSALVVVPLLSIMEHITIVKKYGSGMMDANQEMLAIGVTNIVGSFFSSMPVTGSFSRSVVNSVSGAESPLGGLITGSLVLLALQFLTPYFYYIPNASLAAVIISAVIFTVDIRIALDMWRSKKMDLIPWAVTFFVSLLVALEVGILCGIVISVIFLLYYAARPALQIQKAETTMGNEFVIVRLDRSLVFPSVEYIRYMVTKTRTTWAKGFLPVAIDCQHIQFADFSAAQGIRDLFTMFNEKNHPLILWRAKPSIIRILKGLMDSCNVSFQYCMKEDELERIVDGDDQPIEFTVSAPSPLPSQTKVQVYVQDLSN